MNSMDYDTPGRSSRSWLDAGVAVALGIALLALGAVDVRAYRTGRHKAWREFPLLVQSGDVRVENVELYRGRFALVQFENIGLGAGEHHRDFRRAQARTAGL